MVHVKAGPIVAESVYRLRNRTHTLFLQREKKAGDLGFHLSRLRHVLHLRNLQSGMVGSPSPLIAALAVGR
jgi:hypothetical protein